MTRQSSESAESLAIVPIILAQVITVIWSKASRGGREAEVRNRVPAALPLPTSLGPDAEQRIILHEVWYCEEDRFAQPRTATVHSLPAVGTFQCGGIALTLVEGTLRVDLHWGVEAPRRRPIRGVMTLRPEEWGQIRYNGRSSGVTGYDHPWRYTLHTINAGLFGAPHADAFLIAEPAKSYWNMADLW